MLNTTKPTIKPSVLQWDNEDELKTYAKVVFAGYPGSGKTRSAIEMARQFVTDESKIGVINSEGASGAKVYRSLYPSLKIITLESYSPKRFIAALEFAISSGCEAVIIDSISDEWNGTLAWKNENSKKMSNEAAAWREPTEAHDNFMKLIRSAPIHTFCTVLTKNKIAIERVDGKASVRKINGAWIARVMTEKNFDLSLIMEDGGNGTVDKTHYPTIEMKKTFSHDISEIAKLIKEFLYPEAK